MAVSEGQGLPLERIREKEVELERKLMEARRQAEAIVREGRQKAADIVEEGETLGLEEAQAFYQERVGKAEAEAATLVAEARGEAEEFSTRGEKNIPQAVEWIVKAVLQ